MEILIVAGTVVATQKSASLQGYKLLLVVDPDSGPDGQPIVALDTVGAGEGERVLVVRGSSARLAANLERVPVDAAIVGIVDQIDRDSREIFRKSGEIMES